MIPESIIQALLDTIDIDDGLGCVQENDELLLSDAAEAELTQRLEAETDPVRRQQRIQCLLTVRALASHRALLASMRAHLAQASVERRRLRKAHEALIAWMAHARDWKRSQAHMRAHASEIFGRPVERALAYHLRAWPYDPWLRLPRSLRARCRAIGVARAYAAVRSGIRAVVEDLRQCWIADAMAVFLAAESPEEMRQALAKHPELVRSEYARCFLALLLEAARDSGSAELCALMEARLTVYQEAQRS